MPIIHLGFIAGNFVTTTVRTLFEQCLEQEERKENRKENQYEGGPAGSTVHQDPTDGQLRWTEEEEEEEEETILGLVGSAVHQELPDRRLGQTEEEEIAAGEKRESAASNDALTSDSLSDHSSARESTSGLEEDTGGEQVDGMSTLEETIDKVKECIDNLMNKNERTCLAALWSLERALSSRVLHDFLTEKHSTVSYYLERSLKKGGGWEQAAAAIVFTLLCIQLGCGNEAEECLKMLHPILTTILMDNSASIVARKSCARALGMCCYISAAYNEEDLIETLALLESVFMSSYPNREGTMPTPKPSTAGLHSAALQAWSLLVTLCPANRLTELLDFHLPKLQTCLQSSDVNYRIVVGETIALLVELGRDIDEEFEVGDSEGLCECLKSLATDGNQHRPKNNTRKQGTVFKEVLHYIENKDFTEEKIRFGVESIYIDSWMRRRIYHSFREILNTGVRHHLQFNVLLRDIFGLGAPLVLDADIKGKRLSRLEKHLAKSAAFKVRTKQMNKIRDKRAPCERDDITRRTETLQTYHMIPSALCLLETQRLKRLEKP